MPQRPSHTTSLPASEPSVTDEVALDDLVGADEEIAAWVRRANSRNLADIPALSAFQKMMGQYPQLSAQSQLELVERVRAGAAAEERLAGNPSARQRTRLQRAVKEGKRATEYLAGSNFRLVLLICNEKAKERFGLERAADVLPDLVGEANVALVEAINDYDPERCPVFSTYAAKVVRDRVQFSLSRDSIIRLAPSWNRMKRIAAIRQPQLATELGRDPTLDELREDLFQQCRVWAFHRLSAADQKLPEDEREELMMAKLRKQGMLGALDALPEVLLAAQAVSSLDAQVGLRSGGEGGTVMLGDFVANPDPDDFLDSAELEELRASLEAALAELGEREQGVIRMRYGMTESGEPAQPCTYAQIGAEYNVTAERIRQIERGVLDRLAESSGQRDRLAAFLPSRDDDS